ncbi:MULTISPECIES: sensor histidine kinase [unclassified Streptomyces]|uniref:sensor histidine kinase n=1 Tax=unclassified Streptomyces TaxID=2593676 RepID=UPI0037F6E8DE
MTYRQAPVNDAERPGQDGPPGRSRVAAGVIYLSVGSLVGILLVPLTIAEMVLRVVSALLNALPLLATLLVQVITNAVRGIMVLLVPGAEPLPERERRLGPTLSKLRQRLGGMSPGLLSGLPLLRAVADLELLLAASVTQDPASARGLEYAVPEEGEPRHNASGWGESGYLCLLLLGLLWLLPVFAMTLPAVAFIASLPFGRTEQLAFGEGTTVVVQGGVTRLCVAVGAVALFAALVMLLFWLGKLRARLVRRLLGHMNEDERRRREELAERQRTAALRVNDADYRRIERDLHDGAQARLAVLLMRISHATRRKDRSAEDLRELLQETHQEIGKALDEIRDLVRGIQPPILSDRGLNAAVTALTETFHVPVHVTSTLERRPATQVESTAYYIIAESLANAVKHSSATCIHVSLERADNCLVVVVTDDGVGGATLDAGTGLRGLVDRTAALRGKLVLTSPVGGPTTARAILPWSPDAI